MIVFKYFCQKKNQFSERVSKKAQDEVSEIISFCTIFVCHSFISGEATSI